MKPDPKAKVRNRPSPVFDSKHPKVNDNKDHFPLGDEDQARNALAQANKYKSAPEWWDGSLQELLNAVARKVKSKYPGIKVTKESTKPGKKKASDEPTTLKSPPMAEHSNNLPIDFEDVLGTMLRLKSADKLVYEMALKELQDKVDSQQSHRNWNPEQLKVLLNELENI